MRKFGLISDEDFNKLKKMFYEEEELTECISLPELTKQDFIEQMIKNIKSSAYFVSTVFDNLANQILARCIIVANRLTHGIDKESEENIMSLAFSYQKCS